MNFIDEFRQKHTRSALSQLKSIQALRAIAAISVMFAHLYGVEKNHSDLATLLSPLALSGMAGVDLFFVISGFIIVWVAADWAPGTRSSAAFLYARVTRIYPTWWLFAGALAVYLYITQGVPWDPTEIDGRALSGSEHLIKSLLLIPHDALPILELGWTLVHEMYFYLVFALILLLPKTWRIPAMGAWAALLIAAIVSGWSSSQANTLITLAVYPMTLEFMMGAAVGWILKSGWTSYARPALIAGIAGTLYAILSVDFVTPSASLPLARTFLFGTSAALIIYGVTALEVRTKHARWAHPFLVRIGDWSYSLYLGHLIVIAGLGRLYYPVFGQYGMMASLAFILIAVISAITVAAAAYYLFERPTIRFLRRWRPSHEPTGAPDPSRAPAE